MNPTDHDPSQHGHNNIDGHDAWQQSQQRVVGRTAVAWIVIIAAVLAAIMLHALPEAEDPDAPQEDSLGRLMISIQGHYVVGAGELLRANRRQLYSQAEDVLNTGSVSQRQRFIVVAAELAGADAARDQLHELDELIDQESAELAEPEQRIQRLLHELYAGGDEELARRLDALTDEQRDSLQQELGWFGRLALTPAGIADESSRDAVLSPARRVAGTFLAAFGSGIVLAFLGFIGLVALVVLFLTGTVRSGMGRGRVHHGIYAETFAIWMAVFLAIQILAAIVSTLVPAAGLVPVAAGFFLSLVVLGWPMLRGASWSDVRSDIGLTLGRRPLIEPLVGVAGYAMALPMVAVGVGAMFVLMIVQQLFSSPGQPLDAAGMPAHPIVDQLGGASWWPLVQILFLAVIAAPVVEEIMFRGVLYRHLRDATRATTAVASILLSATISGFVFAIIHPQGWVAVPLLMSLAYAFVLVREWRGTIIPSIVVHAISNGLVMTLLIAVTRAVA